MPIIQQTLVEKLNSVSEMGFLKKDIPSYILRNLNPRFLLREYQREALTRFQFYYADYKERKYPVHLLFNMATGSGKTLLMAANILYLYQQGYRNFVFFVNSTNIIKKTQANFLDKTSSKYLFADKATFNDREVNIQEVQNFEAVNPDNVNILFTTIQGLHSRLNNPQENSLNYEDFQNMKIVFLSDEAHHINTLTKNSAKMTKQERDETTSWEYTVRRILNSNGKNIMLEYTATVDLANTAIREKYADKIIYQYNLREFREDGFSKDVQIIQSDLDIMDRALQAIILSQYKRKVAEKHKIRLKPVILIKSQKTIAQSEEAEKKFYAMIKSLKVSDIKRVEASNKEGVLKQAFIFFRNHKITFENLMREIQEDFCQEKCRAVNSQADSEEKQIEVNTLETENNEVRLIFAVNMLNEGWDVLNLFDIVRLYETRDAKGTRAGSTTISEAQLIGRGARYFPFKIEEGQDIFKRKYDEDITNELRILEELHYHSLNDSRYISEIKAELVKSGIAPPDDRRKQITVNLKDKIKTTKFWKSGIVFLNELKKNDNADVKSLKDILSDSLFKYKLRLGRTFETKVFEEQPEPSPDISGDSAKKTLTLNRIDRHIDRKALDKVDFYRFCNLKRFFPALSSIDEFITSENYSGQVEIEVYGTKEQLNSLDNHDKFEIALSVFKEIAGKIQASSSEFIGTEEFKGFDISKIVAESKTSEILIGGIDKEYGIAMSQTSKEDLRLNLAEHDWYIYDENFGTSEEKYFIQFIRYYIEELRKRYNDIYLLRNESLFKLYRFSDGKAVEPDFVLFLKEKDTSKSFSYQLFVESKGEHLLETDRWKEEFLKEIESKHKIYILFESDKYRIIGLPFYNEKLRKQDFKKVFNEKLKLK